MRLKRHAKERMEEREVELEEVQMVFDDPDITYPGKQGTEAREKNVNGRRLKIVVFCGTDLVKTIIDRDR